MKQKITELRLVFTTGIFILANNILAYATAPDKGKVESVATDGVKMFFGALGGIAVVLGGIEFIQAFLAYRENEEEGGSGEANSKVGKKILAGVFCLIGAILVFIIMNWTLTLFNLPS